MTEQLVDNKGNRRIKFNHSTAQWALVERMNWRFLLMHGDTIKSYLTMPWYGAVRKSAGFQSMLQARLSDKYTGPAFDYMMVGHHHSAGMIETNDSEIIFNSSWVGGNEFANNIVNANNSPTQWFFSLNSKHGITGRWLLDLELLQDKTSVKIYGDKNED